MRGIRRFAVLVLLAVLFGGSGYAQNPASEPQQPGAQASPMPQPSDSQGRNWYVDADGHTHQLLTPEGDIQQPAPHLGPPRGIGAGKPATPAFPLCPPNTEVVRRMRENASDKTRNRLMGYRAFFENMALLDDVAEKDEKKGDHAGAIAWRTHDQRKIRLNDAEGQIMKEVEADLMRAINDYNKKVLQAIRKFRLKTKGDMCAPSPPEFADLDREQWDIVKAHVERLQVALGESSFHKVDKYVHDGWEPKPPLSEQTSTTEKVPKMAPPKRGAAGQVP